jgi:sodium/potassium-transporting ATPase subunit alpha
MGDAVNNTEAIRLWDEHKINIDELCKRLGANKETGFTDEEAKQGKVKFGANELMKKDATPWYVTFIHELTGFFSLLLWFGSFLCFIGFIIQEDKEDLSNLYLGIVLSVVVFLTGVFSYMQTSKSAEMMAQFENFIPDTA